MIMNNLFLWWLITQPWIREPNPPGGPKMPPWLVVFLIVFTLAVAGFVGYLTYQLTNS